MSDVSNGGTLYGFGSTEPEGARGRESGGAQRVRQDESSQGNKLPSRAPASSGGDVSTPSVLHALDWDSFLPPPDDVGHTADCQGCELERLWSALERIGWHELTWKEARDAAREALASSGRGAASGEDAVVASGSSSSPRPDDSRTDWVAQLRNMHGDVEFWDELVDVVDAATWCYHTQFSAYGYKSQLEAALSNLRQRVES